MQTKPPVQAVTPMATRGGDTSAIHESDRTFLDKNEVSSIFRDLLGKLVERKPDDPLNFISEYFQTIDSRSLTLEEAERHLLLTDYRSPVFRLHLQAAYNVLTKMNKARRSAHLLGAIGDDINKLVQILLKETPKRDLLVPKLKLKAYCYVPFDVVRSIVITCLVYKDFMKSSKELFKEVKELSDGRPNESITSTILAAFNKMIKDDTPNFKSHNLKSSLVKIPAKKYTSVDVLSEDQFLGDMANIFLSKVSVIT